MSADEVDALIRERRPGIVRGLAARWPAFRTWSFEHLADTHASVSGEVMPTEGGVLRADERRGFVTTSHTLADFVGRVRAGVRDAGYLTATLDELPPALRAAIEPPRAWHDASFRRGKLWMSARGTVSPLHFDASDNVHVVLRGRKVFRTFAPGDRRNVYPCSLLSGTPNFSRVDAEAPDLVRFPDFARATPTLHELGEGDAVFLPSGWWHHVRSTEESLAVNFWWSSGPRALVSHAADTWKRLRAVSR